MYLYINLLKVVSYLDLSVLSMSVMGFKKKNWIGVGWWGELYPSFFWIFGIVLTLQSPLNHIHIQTCVVPDDIPMDMNI